MIARLGFAQNTPGLVWAKYAGGVAFQSDASSKSVALDKDSNVYVAGSFKGTVDLDPSENGISNIESAGFGDLFIAKYTKDGVFVWGKRIGGEQKDEANDIHLDASGNVYVTGYFEDTVDFDPGVRVANLYSDYNQIYIYRSAFVLKLDADGNHVWAHKIGHERTANSGATTTVYGYSIATDSKNNVLVAGNFNGDVDFDPSDETRRIVSNTSSSAVLNGFVAKYDASGGFVWAKSLGSSNGATVSGLAVNSLGEIIVTGNFRDSTDFDPDSNATSKLTSTSQFSYDVYVWSLSANGIYRWAKGFGGTEDDFSSAIALDNQDNIYTTGNFRGDIHFDPSPNSDSISSVQNSGDVFVSKLTSGGEYVWAKSFGGWNTDAAYDIAVDSKQQVYTMGYFIDSVDFDPGPNKALLGGYKAVFVSQLNENGDYLNAYQIDNNGTFLSNSGGLAVDNAGNVVVTHDLIDVTDMDPTVCVFNLSNTIGTGGFFLQKVNPKTIPSCLSIVSVTIQPKSMAVCSGKIATFSVIASGSNLVYQWQKLNAATGAYSDLAVSNDYLGAKSSVLTINTKSGLVNGTYRCKIGLNLFSDNAILTFSPAPSVPTILTQNQEACSGTQMLQVQGFDQYKWSLANAVAPDTLKIVSQNISQQGQFPVVQTSVSNYKTGTSKLYLITRNTAGCSRLDSTKISYYPNEKASLSNGAVVGDSVLLKAIPIMRGNTSYSGTWSIVQGEASIRNRNANSTYAKLFVLGEYKFIYTSSNSCKTIDTITVFRTNSSVVIKINAGRDLTTCTDTATLAATAVPQGYVGVWRSGNPKVKFSDSTKVNSKVSGLVIGRNELFWLAKSGNEVRGRDTVFLTSIAGPSSSIPNYQRVCPSNPTISLLLKNNETISFTSTKNARMVKSTIGIDRYEVFNLARFPNNNVFSWTLNNGVCTKTGQLTIFLSDTVLIENKPVSGIAGDTIKVKVSDVSVNSLFSKTEWYDSLIVEEIAGTKSGVVLKKYTVGDTMVHFVTNRKLISKETYLYRLRNSCGIISDTASLIVNTTNEPPEKKSITIAPVEGQKIYTFKFNFIDLDRNRYLDTIYLLNAPEGVRAKISYPDSLSVIFEIDLSNVVSSSEVQSVQFRLADTGSEVGSLIFLIPAIIFDLIVYNALSPNGDGQNDVFQIDGITLEKYRDNKVEIFNRWGDRVYKASGYNNNEVAFDGDNLPDGTYYYIINVGEKRKLYKGFLILKR